MRLTDLGSPIPETEEEFAFWAQVAYVGAGPDECWAWKGAGSKTRHNSKREGQYGRFSYQGKNPPAHRVAWQMLVGPLTREEHVDHMCEFGLCVNPRHLEPKPLFDNVARSPKQVAILNRAKTHCPKGHPYDEKNTHVTKTGSHRVCRACAAERQRLRYAADPAKYRAAVARSVAKKKRAK